MNLTESTFQPKHVRWISVLLLGLRVFSGEVALAEVCKGSKVPRAELRRSDAQATLSPQEAATALATHLPWGQPACPKLLPNREYILCFTPMERVPLWAAYELRKEDLVNRKRRDAFRSDPRLTVAENPRCRDYQCTGFHRGHLVPDADMGRSTMAQANTYFLSNMSPQWPRLNSGPWLWLERTVRDYATFYGKVYVISGSIVSDPPAWVPSKRVGVPARFYKVLLRTDATGQPLALAVALSNQKERFELPDRAETDTRPDLRASDLLLEAHLVSIREIERLTGLDLLPRLDRAALKEAVVAEVWSRNRPETRALICPETSQ